MPAKADRHLRPVDENDAREATLLVVNPATGESIPFLEYTQDLRDQIEGLETDVRSWRTRHANLKRDKQAEATRHALWPRVLELFEVWKVKCNHPKTNFDADYFECGRIMYERHGEDVCKLAIEGAAYAPSTKPRRNGTVERFDDFELIFRSETKLASFVNRAPRELLQAHKAKVTAAQQRLDVPQAAE